MKSRSRRFWILIGAITLLISILIIALPIYFVTLQHKNESIVSPTVTPGVQKTSDIVPNSFLVDVATAEDEDTRAAVTIFQMVLTLEPKQNYSRLG